jgi:hypothetical protein
MLLWYDQNKFGYTPLKIHNRIRGYMIQNNAFVFIREWNLVPVTRKESPKKPTNQAFSHINVLQILF